MLFAIVESPLYIDFLSKSKLNVNSQRKNLLKRIVVKYYKNAASKVTSELICT